MAVRISMHSPREIYLRLEEAEVEGLRVCQAGLWSETQSRGKKKQNKLLPLSLQRIPVQPEYLKAIGASFTQHRDLKTDQKCIQ